MADPIDRVARDRELLEQGQQQGLTATLAVYLRLAGPGWLQSAITLGGGSLAGALFLGALGGVSLLWLQLMAITMGVIMLSAISYVTLSTGERPFAAIHRHINPALAWSWLLATSLANMIWCMPQFALSYTALQKNLLPGWEDSLATQWTVSLVLLGIVSAVLALHVRGGWGARLFDMLLKGLVGLVVLCFAGVVALLGLNGELPWGEIFRGFWPDLRQWTQPSGQIATLMAETSEGGQAFWGPRVVSQQRSQMIAAAATAVGINMTFLMPYSLLHRGWDRTFRGLARFDLLTGMAIPYVLVTSCVVIAAAHAFHGKADKAFLSDDPAVFSSSPTFAATQDTLLARVQPDASTSKYLDLSPEQQSNALAAMSQLPDAEKKIAASMVRRNADALAQTLAPLIGERLAQVVFGLGVFGMGFSTIIILMLINGYVVQEALGQPTGRGAFVVGCLIAGGVGTLWPFVWSGDSQFWFTIVASNFGMMLLPIAYITFWMMINSRSLLGNDKPSGLSAILWNALMLFAVAGACAAAGTSIYDRVADTSSPRAILAGRVVLGMVALVLVAVVVGFAMKRPNPKSAEVR